LHRNPIQNCPPIFSLLLTFCFVWGCRRNPQFHDHPRQADGVSMQDVSFLSAALGQTVPYRVFLPASLPQGRKLPVVYLLHGGGDNYRSWSNNSAVAQYARNGFILVMPDGDDSYFMNEALAPKKRYKDFITRDLIADVESRFPAQTDRESRAVIGISMGGFAGIEYALTVPNLYAFVGALSPAIDAPFRRFRLRRFQQGWGFRTIFGPDGSEERASRNPSKLVFKADPRATPYLYITVGEQEPQLAPNRQFVAQLQQRGFAYEFHIEPGGHNWSEWNAQLPGCFASLAQHLRTDAN
jgi:S-formylglutathione hydrolase FrmB